MTRGLGGTISGPDMAALTRALLDALPYTRTEPVKSFEHTLIERALPADWRERLTAPEVESFGVEWADRRSIDRSEGAISLDFPPEMILEAGALLAFLAPLPFELCVLTSVHDDWASADYYSQAISGDHALLGAAMAFKGAAHERSIVSRRWLDHGPFRATHGAHDTTLVLFHDPAADATTSLAQARPGHDWIAAGFLRPKHRYQHDIAGIYTTGDRLLRVLVNGRAVSAAEMRDACAARRDRKHDPERPIDNVAYVFIDEAEARAHLESLWLHGLPCLVADGRGERRLDEAYRSTTAKPGWV
jgi:hypothetical protein